MLFGWYHFFRVYKLDDLAERTQGVRDTGSQKESADEICHSREKLIDHKHERILETILIVSLVFYVSSNGLFVTLCTSNKN